jgi:hypothetical protein
MEKTDFSVYTVKGLQKMANDAGIKGMSKASAKTIIPELQKADLSNLDLDSYAKKKEREPKATKPSFVKSGTGTALSPRRSSKSKAWGRR